MKKTKTDLKIQSPNFSQQCLTMGLTLIFVLATIVTPLAHADRFQDQIDALNNANNQNQAVQGQLGAEAASLSDAIAKLQAEINNLQGKINDNQKKAEDLRTQIAAAQTELTFQRKLLGQTIKVMYLEEEITTVEMLATSKNLSDFFDKQQYRLSVRSKIKTTLDKVNRLKLDLTTQKDTLEKLIEEQQALHVQLASQHAENDRLLSLNQSQRNSLDTAIKANNSKVEELRRQQAAENAKHFKGIKVVDKGSCGGGYPATALNSAGQPWGCSHPKDNNTDNWGMYNRECVSYTAWKIFESGRHMPGWGFQGIGNANQWDDNARTAGIPVNGNPQPGDVAVAHWGELGHVMYVESVNPGGTINISQYNYDLNGTYSEAYNIPTGDLVFIHF